MASQIKRVETLGGGQSCILKSLRKQRLWLDEEKMNELLFSIVKMERKCSKVPQQTSRTPQSEPDWQQAELHTISTTSIHYLWKEDVTSKPLDPSCGFPVHLPSHPPLLPHHWGCTPTASAGWCLHYLLSSYPPSPFNNAAACPSPWWHPVGLPWRNWHDCCTAMSGCFVH